MAKKKAESAPKAAPKKETAKKPTATSSDMPSINTSAAAAAAAAMVGNKVNLTAGGTGSARPESSAFKQMKEGLNKPAAGLAGSLLGTTPGQKKSNAPFAQTKQVGHNQTFGADVNRTGVPRRTGGG